MVGEHNIKVLAVLTHQARLLVSVRPKSLLLWTSLDLGLLRHRLDHGYNFLGWIPLGSLTVYSDSI
jgi:hypothetical protein